MCFSFVTTSSAWAQEGEVQDPVVTGSEASDLSPSAAAATDAGPGASLETEIARVQGHSRIWWRSWLGVLSGLAVGQVGYALLKDGDDAETTASRESLYVGAGFSALGLASVALRAPPVRSAMDELDGLPTGSPEERSARHARALELRDEELAAMRRSRRWLAHLVPAALAGTGGVVLAVRNDGLSDGARVLLGVKTLLGTVLVTELRIWTRPTFSSASEGQSGTAAASLAGSLAVLPWLDSGRGGQGLTLAGRF